MSCYVVSDNQINTMISTVRSLIGHGSSDYLGVYFKGDWIKFNLHDNEDAKKLGEIMLLENWRSYYGRYPSEAKREGTELPTLHFKRMAPVKPVELIKLIDNYHYQICETDDYQESLAYKASFAMMRVAIKNLEGYEKAPWGMP